MSSGGSGRFGNEPDLDTVRIHEKLVPHSAGKWAESQQALGFSAEFAIAGG